MNILDEYTVVKIEYDGKKHVFGRATVYMKNNIIHRDGDLPAVEYDNGPREWRKDGKKHRDDDLPAVIYSHDDKEWWKDGEKHRDGDLPAVIYKDTKEWWKDGKLHRDNDLPAITLGENKGYHWYKHGVQYIPFY